MRRKVIQIADSTLLVSLPKKWAQQYNIKKGDEVDIDLQNGKLVISMEFKPKVEKAEINSSLFGILAKRVMHALYKKGIDEIKINFNKPEDFEIIQDGIRNVTVGYEVIEQTPKFCIIKNVSGESEEFESMLRRIFLILLSFADESYSAIRNKEREHLVNLKQLEKSNNRLTTMCRRYINKVGRLHFNKVGPIYYVVEEIEKIADYYKYIIEALQESNVQLGPEILECYKESCGLLRDYYETFYKFDPVRIMAIGVKHNLLRARLQKILLKSKDYESLVVHYLITINQSIFNCTAVHLVNAL